jgi:hypothetical protein
MYNALPEREQVVPPASLTRLENRGIGLDEEPVQPSEEDDAELKDNPAGEDDCHA